MDERIAYYATHSPITDPGEYSYLYDDLPDDLHEMIWLIQGQMIHRLAAPQFGVSLTRESRSEQRLRTMRQRLGRMMELNPAPLTVEREPREKQVGMCRDFAVFLVSLLRHKGIPARMRVGFADYLGYDIRPFLWKFITFRSIRRKNKLHYNKYQKEPPPPRNLFQLSFCWRKLIIFCLAFH